MNFRSPFAWVNKAILPLHIRNLTDIASVRSESETPTITRDKTRVKGTHRSRKRRQFKRNNSMDAHFQGMTRFKFLCPRLSRKYELVQGIPSKSEVYVGKVRTFYKPMFEVLRQSLTSYILANYQFEHMRRRDLGIELGVGPHARRVDVAHRLANYLVERSIALAEYYSESIQTEQDHANVGLLGLTNLPIFFLRFSAMLTKEQKAFPIPESSSYVFLDPQGYELPDKVLTRVKQESQSPDAQGYFKRDRFKITDKFNFVKELALLRNLCGILDPTLNLNFNIYETMPVLDSLLSCDVRMNNGIDVIHSETLPSMLDTTESILFGVRYEIEGIPRYLQGTMIYQIDKEMLQYLGLKYWESVIGLKGITSTTRIESIAQPMSESIASSILNIPESVSSREDGNFD